MTRYRSPLGVVALTALCGACAPSGSSPAGPTPAGADTVLVVDTLVVPSTADAEMEARIARLEIMLLERDARLVELQQSLDATRQEVVRNLAKLQSQANRAEAASGLAEAEIALQTLERAQGGTALPEYVEAQARVRESSAEFGQENYGGALYLATEARTLARAGQSRLAAGGGEDLRQGETVFATAVPLSTGDQRANVRSGPGLGFDVLFTLEPETLMVGQSYTSEWVRVVLEDGREGWIFHTLVTAR